MPKRSRAVPSLKLDLGAGTKSKSAEYSIARSNLVNGEQKGKDVPLIIDEHVIVTSLKLAQDIDFLKSQQVTHVINCVSQTFETAQVPNITYLNLSLNDSLDQGLLDPVTQSLTFIVDAL